MPKNSHVLKIEDSWTGVKLSMYVMYVYTFLFILFIF
jgi:hypothetical protein